MNKETMITELELAIEDVRESIQDSLKRIRQLSNQHANSLVFHILKTMEIWVRDSQMMLRALAEMRLRDNDNSY